MARRRGLAAPPAFSLLEVLVVVGVLALLLAILVPSLSAARGRARAAQCLSNLQHLAQAAALYTGDNAGFYPLARDDKNEWDITRAPDATGTLVTAPGILFGLPGPGGVDLKIFMCPEYVLASNPSALFTGYNYNTSFIGHGYGEDLLHPVRTVPSVHDDQLMHPATTALFGDGQYSAPDKYMRAPAPCTPATDGGDAVSEATRVAGTQGYRHSGKTNVAWADGHTEAWATRATQTAGRGHLPAAPNSGFISRDNSAYALR